MKWRANNFSGTKIKRVFALLPIKCEDGYWVWLEWAYCSIDYRDGHRYGMGSFFSDKALKRG